MISFMISVVPPKNHNSRRRARIKFMKQQVEAVFMLGSGVDCSPMSVGGSNISSNTTATRNPGGSTWRT
jgi:hypothetical protein